jgi:hypothetical protein
MSPVEKAERLKERAERNKLAKEEFDEETTKYFLGIQCRPVVQLDCYQLDHCSGEGWFAPKSAIVLWIIDSLSLGSWIDFEFHHVHCNSSMNCSHSHGENKEIESIPYSPAVFCGIKQIKFPKTVICSCAAEKKLTKANFVTVRQLSAGSCARPSISVADKKLIICGISSVLRFLLKFVLTKLKSCPSDPVNSCDNSEWNYNALEALLGFRGGCLQACAEVSIWTKFCEVDIFNTLMNVIQANYHAMCTSRNTDSNGIAQELEVPVDLLRLESHLSKPVKIFNIQQKVQSKQKTLRMQMQRDGKLEIESPANLEHDFAEGPSILLSDLLLFPCISFALTVYGREMFTEHLPKTLAWCERLDATFHFSKSNKFRLTRDEVDQVTQICCDIYISNKHPRRVVWKATNVPDESLYKNDPERYNPASRLFTKQTDISESLDSIYSSGIPILEVSEIKSTFNWNDVPVLAHPEGGRLPKSRRERKCQQLSSMAIEVMKVVEEKGKRNQDSSSSIRIVDFCSGGGHVGILLAWLLPKCQIILVENKEESLRRGRERVEQLRLANVTMYQCNLDYFDGQFEIGVALHACGTATDLVLSKCCGESLFCMLSLLLWSYSKQSYASLPEKLDFPWECFSETLFYSSSCLGSNS